MYSRSRSIMGSGVLKVQPSNSLGFQMGPKGMTSIGSIIASPILSLIIFIREECLLYPMGMVAAVGCHSRSVDGIYENAQNESPTMNKSRIPSHVVQAIGVQKWGVGRRFSGAVVGLSVAEAWHI